MNKHEREARRIADLIGWRIPHKSHKCDTRLTAGMPEWLKERLRAAARKAGCSMSEWCRRVVWSRLKDE